MISNQDSIIISHRKVSVKVVHINFVNGKQSM